MPKATFPCRLILDIRKWWRWSWKLPLNTQVLSHLMLNVSTAHYRKFRVTMSEIIHNIHISVKPLTWNHKTANSHAGKLYKASLVQETNFNSSMLLITAIFSTRRELKPKSMSVTVQLQHMPHWDIKMFNNYQQVYKRNFCWNASEVFDKCYSVYKQYSHE